MFILVCSDNGMGYAAGHAIAKAAGCEVYHIDEKTPLSYNKENLLNPWFVVKPVNK